MERLLKKLSRDRDRVDSAIERLLTDACTGQSPVQDAMRDATQGGQRIRPILAMRAATMTGADSDQALRAGCAVELLHCASLIVDDLPSMDNELMRRGSPTIHVKYGEATAILSAFALVALAARTVIDQPRFQAALLRTMDCSGLIGGQSMDLSLSGEVREANRIQLHEMKTVPLFELAALAGGEPVRAFGRAFGVAFQVVDDYLDGEVAEMEIVERHLERSRAALHRFGVRGLQMEELVDYLRLRTQQTSPLPVASSVVAQVAV